MRQLDDVSRLTIANVDGEIPLFSRAPTGLDIVGVQPRFWGSIQDFLESYRYMTQRRLLTVRSNLGHSFWAWIPASTPAEVLTNIWGDDPPPLVGNTAGAAHPAPADDLPGPGGRLPRPRFIPGTRI